MGYSLHICVNTPTDMATEFAMSRFWIFEISSGE